MMNFIIFLQQLISSSTHIVAKGVTNELEPVLILLFRALIATSVYFAYLAIRRSSWKRIEPRDWWLVALLGILNIPLNQYFFLVGISHTTAPNVSLAYALTPVFVFIVAAIFLKEKVTFLKIVGIAIAVSGAIVLLSEKGFNFSSETMKGDIFALMASFSWGLYTIIGRNFTRKYGAIYSTALAMASGAFFFIPVFFTFGGNLDISHITILNWGQLLYLGAITSGLGYALWFYALKKIEASKLAVFNNFQPVLTAILAFLIFGTHVTEYFIIGGIMIIAGVILTQKG
ncbi:MAG: EamA family transporter [Candidatus Kapabacteria bacterium]|nr:EamA family transporter [Ignavibacteriota bacterium]MCW5884662.1 EamA family transporter [Candidatus Kapabacteria bacterium]